MIAYGPCVDPWLICAAGGADEVEEFFEPAWSLVDYPFTVT